MHALKIIVATIGVVILIIGSIVVTIAALWGKPTRSSREDNIDRWDESIEDM